MERTAAAYARYSTDHQTENSIAYQMHEITGYCAKNNIRLTHSFIDEGQSGTNTDRDGFQDMLAAARAKEFSTIIIYDVSRGSRDISDWFSFRKQMRELGISVISCHQQLGDPLNPDDFLREFITVGLGHHMVLETRQKSMDGVSAAAREGLFLGGTPPYGYAIENQRYVIVPSEAAFVRKAFHLYYEGYSYNYIMDTLHVSNVVGRKGSRMNKNSLYYMFKNPRYAGIYVWNEYTYQVMRKYVGRKANPREIRIEGVIPPIVSKEVWLAVQKRLETNKKNTRRVSSSARRVFLLSGLIKCGRCGSNYIAHASTSKGHEYTYYCCCNRYGKKRLGTNACQSSPVRGDALEKVVIEAVKKCLTENTDFHAFAEHVAEKFNEANLIDVSAEKKELESVKAKLNNGIQAILNGIDAPELSTQVQYLKARKQTLEDTIAHALTKRKVIDVDALANLLRSNVEKLDNADPETVKTAIQRHVPYIIAEEDGSFTVAVGYVLSDTGENHKKITPSYGKNEVVCHVEAQVQKSASQPLLAGDAKTRVNTGLTRVVDNMAGAVRLELTTYGFGDRCSTN